MNRIDSREPDYQRNGIGCLIQAIVILVMLSGWLVVAVLIMRKEG